MSWRVARSLLVLRDQLDARCPGRSKASDGTIGDAAHQASVSDHNPDAAGVVRALDITHDPAHGCDINWLSDALIGSRDPRISYVIANRLISGPNYGWSWAAYDGDDPHTGHLHLSVVGDGRADDQRQWQLGATPGGDDMAGETADFVASHVPDPTGGGALYGSHIAIGDIWARVRALADFARDETARDGVEAAKLAEVDAAVDAIAAAIHAGQPVALTPAQLDQLGAAAATQAATILGERLEVLEGIVGKLLSARAAASAAESDALAP